MREGFDKQLALRLLREQGITKVILEFSGGNDEGGVDDAKYYGPESIKDTDGVPQLVEVDGNSELSAACEAAVYGKYYGFAGNWYVNGTVTFDVAAGTVTLDAVEEIPTDHSVKESF